MAQKLHIKTTVHGSEVTKTVNTIRSWGDSSGPQIYLHQGGFYAYKNEEPIRDERDFDVIGDRIQREIALRWWKRIGKKESEEYYAQKDEEARIKAGDFDEAAIRESEMDSALYIRYSPKDGYSEGLEPFSWNEFFSERPLWWGQANKIEFNDWVYERFVEKISEKPKPKTDEKKSPDSEGKDSKKDDAAPDTGATGPTGPTGTDNPETEPDITGSGKEGF